MSIRQNVNYDEWQTRLQEITSGNQGRKAAIAADGMTLVENQSFESVNYDSPNKGNDLMIAVKGYTHTVEAPTEMIIVKSDNGVISTLEIVDQNNEKTYLRFI